jgi:phosphoglycerate dehydrogenase-like enzyme
MKKLKVVYYARKEEPPQWRQGVVEAFRGRHDLRLFDLQGPVAPQFKDADMVIDCGGWATREKIDAAVNAKLWQILGTGLDHTDVPYLKSKGIMVANCPGTGSSVGLAECAMMFILMLTRHWHTSSENLRNGILWKPFGQSLLGSTLAIIGFGSSGQELARRAKSFGMRIEAIDIAKIDPKILDEIKPDFVGTPDNLDEVIKRCDFLSLHLHLNGNTRRLIDAGRLTMMKPTACIINVARGALVDETAMYKALLDGKLGGAGLDVFAKEPPDMNEPAFKLPNVVLTPHIAGVTDETARRRAAVALENADRLADGRRLICLVET